jgi:hypothetical protein
MTKNPFYNALFAIAYIMVLITAVFSTPASLVGQRESFFVPIGMLGLLVLSVALMAYLFFYQPVIMLIEGERQKAVKLFLQTVGIFAVETGLVLIISIILSR